MKGEMSPLFKAVKALYINGSRFETHRTGWAGMDVKDMASQLLTFSPYLLSVYDCFFVEMQDGVAGIVTAIQDHGIRVEYPLPQRSHYEWIQGDNIEKWGLRKQPSMLDMMFSEPAST